MHKHNRRGMWLMMLACLVPMALVVLYLARGRIGSPGSLLPYAFLLLCPLMHIFMMRGMHGSGDRGCHDSVQRKEVETDGGQSRS